MDNMSKAFFQNIGIDAEVIPSDNTNKAAWGKNSAEEEKKAAAIARYRALR